MNEYKDLLQAGRTEKDPVTREKIIAVSLHKNENMSRTRIGRIHGRTRQTVSNWIGRYEKYGIAGLESKPIPGRPPTAELAQIRKILAKTDNITTPKKLRREIHETPGVKYHITNVRKIMRKLGLSGKTIRRVHIRRPEMEEIRRWQRNATARIPRLESKGFATVIFDEAIFMDDPKAGAKYRSPRGLPIVTTYKGRHGRSVAYGALATDGRQFIRVYGKFNRETVLQYFKELVRHFHKVTIVMDNASRHRARIVQEFLGKNPNVRVIWLPTATPELGAIEEYWHRSKREVLVSEYYATVVEMRKALSEYLRTARPQIDVMAFIRRKSFPVKNF